MQQVCAGPVARSARCKLALANAYLPRPLAVGSRRLPAASSVLEVRRSTTRTRPRSLGPGGFWFAPAGSRPGFLACPAPPCLRSPRRLTGRSTPTRYGRPSCPRGRLWSSSAARASRPASAVGVTSDVRPQKRTLCTHLLSLPRFARSAASPTSAWLLPLAPLTSSVGACP